MYFKELYIIGFAQALFFSLLILSKKNKKTSDVILIFFILLLGMDLLYNYFVAVGLNKKYPIIVLSDFAYWALLGPVLYVYTDLSVHRNKLKLAHALHLLPLLIVYSFFSNYIFNYMSNSTFADYFYKTQYKSTIIGVYFWEIVSPIYYIITAIKIQRHQKNIQYYFSNKKNIDFTWLKYLTHGFGLFLIVGSISLLLRQLFGVILPFKIYTYSDIILLLYIFGIGFWGYKQKGIFSNLEEGLSAGTLQGIKIEKLYLPKRYQHSALNDKDAYNLMQKLKEVMQSKKLFLNSEITIHIVANELNTTTHKLSQVINNNIGVNFYEFVNQYRIEEIKKLLIDPSKSNFKIESLAYDCGFNSKSAFYTLFKKYTLLTPAEYRKQAMVKTA